MIVVINREVWPLRFLFVCVVFCAFLSPDSPISALLFENGWPFFTIYLALFFFWALPLLGAEWALGHWLKGTTGAFLTIPLFGAFAVGIVVLNLMLAPLQAASTGLTAYYLYHTFTPNMYRKMTECEPNESGCCSLQVYETLKLTSRHNDISCPFPNASLRFYDNVINLNGQKPKGEDLEISNPINWHYWLGILATFGVAFFVVAAGPMTMGFFSLIHLLAIFGLMIAMTVLLKFQEHGEVDEWSYFTKTMKDSKWDALNTRDLWDSTLMLIFRYSTLGLGIMPALAQYNYPASGRWYITDVLFIIVVLPAFVILEGVFYANIKRHYMDMIPSPPSNWNFKYGIIPILMAKLSVNKRLFTALYYLMEFLRGSLAVAFNLEVVNSCIMHLLELCMIVRKPVFYRPIISFLSAIVLTFLSIVYCARGGLRLRNFVDNYVHRFVPVFLVVEVLILVIVLIYEQCNSKRRSYSCGRKVCRLISVPILLLMAAVATYVAYLLNRETFNSVHIVGWVVALLPLAVTLATIPILLTGLCCYACLQTDDDACLLVCGPHFARDDDGHWDLDDDEEFAMLEKYN